MTLQETIQRFQTLIEKAELLHDDEFNFSDLVNDSIVKQENGKAVACGTVCCFAGWMPQWFPDSGFKWEITNWKKVYLSFRGGIWRESMVCGLVEWFGVSSEIIGCLFFGESLIVNANTPQEVWFKSFNTFTRTELIERFKKMRDCLEMEVVPRGYEFLETMEINPGFTA